MSGHPNSTGWVPPTGGDPWPVLLTDVARAADRHGWDQPAQLLVLHAPTPGAASAPGGGMAWAAPGGYQVDARVLGPGHPFDQLWGVGASPAAAAVVLVLEGWGSPGTPPGGTPATPPVEVRVVTAVTADGRGYLHVHPRGARFDPGNTSVTRVAAGPAVALLARVAGVALPPAPAPPALRVTDGLGVLLTGQLRTLLTQVGATTALPPDRRVAWVTTSVVGMAGSLVLRLASEQAGPAISALAQFTAAASDGQRPDPGPVLAMLRRVTAPLVWADVLPGPHAPALLPERLTWAGPDLLRWAGEDLLRTLAGWYLPDPTVGVGPAWTAAAVADAGPLLHTLGWAGPGST